VEGNYYRTYSPDNGTRTSQYPRLGPLADGGRIAYYTWQNIDKEGKMNSFYFVKGDISTWIDPRLTEAHLIKRGVEIRDISIVRNKLNRT
jgi:hypothetical protein